MQYILYKYICNAIVLTFNLLNIKIFMILKWEKYAKNFK